MKSYEKCKIGRVRGKFIKYSFICNEWGLKLMCFRMEILWDGVTQKNCIKLFLIPRMKW